MPAVAEKPPVVEPLETVTDPGTDSAAELLESVTVTPPAPAACESVTVQEEVPPEPRLVGEQASDVKAGGVSTNVRD